MYVYTRVRVLHICIYIRTCIFTYIYICVYMIYTYIYIYVYMIYTYIYIYMYVFHICAYMYVYIYMYVCIYTRACPAYMYIYTYIHLHLHIYISDIWSVHIYVCAYIYINMWYGTKWRKVAATRSTLLQQDLLCCNKIKVAATKIVSRFSPPPSCLTFVYTIVFVRGKKEDEQLLQQDQRCCNTI